MFKTEKIELKSTFYGNSNSIFMCCLFVLMCCHYLKAFENDTTISNSTKVNENKVTGYKVVGFSFSIAGGIGVISSVPFL
jgi:hypothetical protein